MVDIIEKELIAHNDTIQLVIDELQTDIKKACNMAAETIKSGNKILFFGNGGRFAAGFHLVSEMLSALCVSLFIEYD